jgi:hypothetical protein
MVTPGSSSDAPALDAGTAADFAPPIAAADGGTAKRPAQDGGAADAAIVAVDGGCECHLGQPVCQANTTVCSTDADCPSFFTCVIQHLAVAACDPSTTPGAGASECQAMMGLVAPVDDKGFCTPKYKDGVVIAADGGTTTTAPEASDPGAGGRQGSVPPTAHGGSPNPDAGVDDGASVAGDQPHCSVGPVGAGRAQSSGFVMFGVLIFALRLRRQRKRA